MADNTPQPPVPNAPVPPAAPAAAVPAPPRSSRRTCSARSRARSTSSCNSSDTWRGCSRAERPALHQEVRFQGCRF